MKMGTNNRSKASVQEKKRPRFTMLVGLPGSGKTYYAEKIKGNNTVHLQSHVYSQRFYNNQNLGRDSAFKVMNSKSRKLLERGKSVIYDATNVKLEDRLKALSALDGVDCEKVVVILATPIDKCVEWDSMTETPAPKSAIVGMLESWCTPCLDEGWDRITVYHTDTIKFSQCVSDCYEASIDGISIDKLINASFRYAPSDFTTRLAIVMHYVGFMKCKTKEVNGVLKYYRTNNVAAYYALLLDLPINALKMSAALSYHGIDKLSQSRKDFVNDMSDSGIKRNIWNLSKVFSTQYDEKDFEGNGLKDFVHGIQFKKGIKPFISVYRTTE